MYAPSGCAVRLIDLPYKVGAMVAFDEDGYASIYLNARWSYDKQKQALKHELRHIQNDDVYNDKDIRTVEREADGKPMPKPSAEKIPYRDAQRDLQTLRRLGVITDSWRDDPLLMIKEDYL